MISAQRLIAIYFRAHCNESMANISEAVSIPCTSVLGYLQTSHFQLDAVSYNVFPFQTLSRNLSVSPTYR